MHDRYVLYLLLAYVKITNMKHKLVLIFADDSEVVGIDNVLMFNNILDPWNTDKIR